MKRFIVSRWQEFTRAFTGWTGVALAALLGMILGVGAFTVYYSGATDYLGDDPATCANCHAMNEQYEGWLKGPHHDVATCNSCLAPHGDIVGKYVNKADNGFWHALKFTFENYPENIRIRDHNREIVEAACIDCHDPKTMELTITRPAFSRALLRNLTGRFLFPYICVRK